MKYNEEQIQRAINSLPSWMKANYIGSNGRVMGEYRFESKEINLLTYNDALRRKLYDFEAPYLRDVVWTLSNKMGLMWSIIHDIKIPNFWLAERLEDASKCDIIDSKNRSVAIFEFFNNDYPIPVSIDDKTYFVYWKDIEKCTPPLPGSSKKLTEFQERLKCLNQVIKNYTISVNKVFGCSIIQRSQLSSMLSNQVSWTAEEHLFNFNWFAKSLFKFLFNYCIRDTGLNEYIRNKEVSNNKRDKGTIFAAKIFFLLYGNLFKDVYADRHLGNNSRNCKKEKKNAFVKYMEDLDDKIIEFNKNNEKLINSVSSCKEFFEYLEVDFQKVESLKKTCCQIVQIFKVNSLPYKIAVNDIQDIVVNIERNIIDDVLTHAMIKNNKNRVKFFNLIKIFREAKDKMGDEATSQSSTPKKIRIRRIVFEKCLKEIDLDLGFKKKKITEKQKQNALFKSNGFDPITGEKLIAGDIQFDHGNPSTLSSDPGRIVALSSESNRLKNNSTPEFTENLNNYNKNN